jgi:glycosyltransferase involved in cell wall biosynthesis
MPVYNGEAYLRQAMESVLAQEFGDFELVVGDDASRDGTLDIVHSFKDGRIRVLSFADNLGLAGNWNRTIQSCRGNFVKYLAQDDLFCPGALRAFFQATTRFSAQSFFFCANEQIDSRGNHLRWRRASCQAGPQSPAQLLALIFLRGNQIGGPTNTLVRSGVFAEVGWFDPRCKYSLDWVMWTQIARRHGGVHIDEPLVRIREHEGSETRRLARLDASWWDSYEALRVLRQRDPELVRWLNLARGLKAASLPRYAARLLLKERVLPLRALQHARRMLHDGLWW